MHLTRLPVVVGVGSMMLLLEFRAGQEIPLFNPRHTQLVSCILSGGLVVSSRSTGVGTQLCGAAIDMVAGGHVGRKH